MVGMNYTLLGQQMCQWDPALENANHVFGLIVFFFLPVNEEGALWIEPH